MGRSVRRHSDGVAFHVRQKATFGLFSDSLAEFATGLTGLRWALLSFICLSELVLLGMQYFWSSKIVNGLILLAKGKPPANKYE